MRIKKESDDKPGSVPSRGVVIPLGVRLPVPSSNLPESIGRASRSTFLFGLASDGVFLAYGVTVAAGRLLPYRFTLTLRERMAVCFLWHFPKIALPGRYPASCSTKPGLSSPNLTARDDDLSNS